MENEFDIEPRMPVRLVFNDHEELLQPNSVTSEIIGCKAFGLSTLPSAWTLPFIVISQELTQKYSIASSDDRTRLVSHWSSQILISCESQGISRYRNIIVRSSGQHEGMDDRGQLCSAQGRFAELISVIENCLMELVSISNWSILQKVGIPLIIQASPNSIAAKGHLSNELHFYKEARDFLGTYENSSVGEQIFEIHLRNWRKRFEVSEFLGRRLDSAISTNVSAVLKIPASWAMVQKDRVHFEWVWDGSTVYLVQADRALDSGGSNPIIAFANWPLVPTSFEPIYLERISKRHSLKFEKIKNVFLYMDLGLPVANIYVLEDMNRIRGIASGELSPDLQRDIDQLVVSPLIIRTDIADVSKAERQLLPRLQVTNTTDALKWLTATASEMLQLHVDHGVAFLFHNFVPATSSAFSYSAPGERLVQIESSWGLPEGLDHFSHYKYVVDTGCVSIERLKVSQFQNSEIINYKGFFVSPDDGRWTIKRVKKPYNWRRSIPDKEWIHEIARQSRRISDATAEPVSIMWFVNCPAGYCSSGVFPWHHETVDPNIVTDYLEYKGNSKYDKAFVVRDKNDIITLDTQPLVPVTRIGRISIQPSCDELLRDKQLLRRVGECAKRIGAVIILKGGVLSHAYYQLKSTGATVQVVHPFANRYSKREFNKLVRDRVPTNITSGGEVVHTATLSGEHFLRALREKLVEEAYEVLDSFDQDSVVGELADVLELVGAIANHIEVSIEALQNERKRKRDRAGGFQDGLILLETQNPLPTSKLNDSTGLFSDSEFHIPSGVGKPKSLASDLGHRIERWSDRKVRGNVLETVMRLQIPVVNDKWNAVTPAINVQVGSSGTVRVQLRAERIGAKCQLDVIVLSPENDQLSLFESELFN